jgi:hypothetical protein
MTIKAFLKNALCGTTEAPCPNGKDVLQIVDCGPTLQALTRDPNKQDYFVWSFVRDPFGRLYSAYSMADSMRDPHHPEFSFEQFVLVEPKRRRYMSRTSPSHYRPQTSFLFDQNECPVFDFIGRLERFDQDLQIVLDRIGSPELQRYYDAHKNTKDMHAANTNYGERKKSSELGGKLSSAYQNPAIVEAAARDYERDFALLRFNNKIVP